MRKETESGFTLIELTIAIAITLIVTGAIFGLVTSSQTAFRKEPESSDRQQNIRVAMAMIANDVAQAGNAMDPFTQVFTRSDTGGACPGAGCLNNSGPVQGSLGPGGQTTRTDSGFLTDALQILSVNSSCPPVDICDITSINIGLNGPAPACWNLQPNVYQNYYVSAAGGSPAAPNNGAGPAGWLLFKWDGHSNGACGDPHMNAQPNHGYNPQPAGFCPNPANCQQIALLQVIRYQVFPDPLDGTPSLWRSNQGITVGTVGTTPDWQLVARGIEDMQVQYQDSTLYPGTPAVWDNDAPVATSPNYNSLVVRVQVTLSSQSTAPNLQGATLTGVAALDANGPLLRGQLTQIIVPRAALQFLSTNANPRLWH